MDWWIIGLIVLALFLVFKVRHIKHRFYLIVFVLLILFLSLTLPRVMEDSSVNLKTASGIYSAAKVYFSWLVHAFNNLKVLTSNAIKMNWFRFNSTG